MRLTASIEIHVRHLRQSLDLVLAKLQRLLQALQQPRLVLTMQHTHHCLYRYGCNQYEGTSMFEGALAIALAICLWSALLLIHTLHVNSRS